MRVTTGTHKLTTRKMALQTAGKTPEKPDMDGGLQLVIYLPSFI